jgi:hypothetical protein
MDMSLLNGASSEDGGGGGGGGSNACWVAPPSSSSSTSAAAVASSGGVGGIGVDMLRVSQAHAALAAHQQPGAPASSHEALALRAMQMFSRSVELHTGGMQWTRGELLGEGSYGRVRNK